MKTKILSFSTEYYQFYVLDSLSEGKTDAPDFWCAAADERRLAIGEGILGITIGTYGTVCSKIQVLESKPKMDLKAEHIIEASLFVKSGLLEVRNCTNYDLQLAIPLEKENYRIRISSYLISTVLSESPRDHYRVQLWKSEFEAPTILLNIAK
jgi:hypothetical protein